jgi:uncharacterized protein (DUF433 family)
MEQAGIGREMNVPDTSEVPGTNLQLDIADDVLYDVFMSRYPLSLPIQLKKEAEEWAGRQGISLNQFILWAVAEKLGALRSQVDDPDFPHITYRRGASRRPHPVLSGTGIRVQAIVTAADKWGLSPLEIADQYGLSETQVREAQAFYTAHRSEIDADIQSESALEPKGG